MITWKYDLDTLEDPILRLGLHGLWRLLHYGENDPLYPMIKQTDHLQWKLTDTSVEITFGDPGDLDPLYQGMVGCLPDGIMVPPGYPRKVQDPRFFVTAMAHSAIASMFSAMSGPRRTKKGEGEVQFNLETITTKKGQDKTFTRKASRHQIPAKTVQDKKNGGDKPNPALLTLRADKKGMVSMKTAFHPAYSQWNKLAVSLPIREAFLTLFACLGYTYSLCNDGYFGLGIDRPTFSEADLKHKRHHGDRNLPQLPRLYGIDAGFAVGALALAVFLGLPDDRPYHILAPNNDQFLNWEADVTTFQIAIGASTDILGRRKEQVAINSVPLVVDGHQPNSKTRMTVLDSAIINVQAGRPWYADLNQLAVMANHPKYKKTPYNTTRLTRFARQMESPMEDQISQEMNRLFNYAAYALGNGGSPDYDKATAEVVMARLQTAVTPQLINAALWEINLLIKRKSDNPIHKSFMFSLEVRSALNAMMKKNPVHVQGLLILACMTHGKSKEERDKAKAEKDKAKTGKTDQDTENKPLVMENGELAAPLPRA